MNLSLTRIGDFSHFGDVELIPTLIRAVAPPKSAFGGRVSLPTDVDSSANDGLDMLKAIVKKAVARGIDYLQIFEEFRCRWGGECAA